MAAAPILNFLENLKCKMSNQVLINQSRIVNYVQELPRPRTFKIIMQVFQDNYFGGNVTVKKRSLIIKETK